jgi:hypothetical protein
MKKTAYVLVLAIACVASSLVLGCAEEEAEAQGPALPRAIGYTPPPETVPDYSDMPGAPPAPVLPPPPAPAAAPGSDGPGSDYDDTDPSALTDFRGALDPYGSWGQDPTYGTVWVPSQSVVGDDFTPYVTAGHWVYDDDYTWVSDYDWGWVPFHYGRWVYGPSFGWGWVPGRRYAPAWVS